MVGAALAWCDARAAAELAVLMLGINLIAGSQFRHGLFRLLIRARWLLLMVAFANAFATPGAPVWPSAPQWLPSEAGLDLAMHRTAALVGMLGAINLVLRSTPNADLIVAIASAAGPLRWLGLTPERVAARLGGAFDLLGATERTLRDTARESGWAGAFARSVAEIELRADSGR